MNNRPAVVLDCGSGFSKLGFSGNSSPSFILPSAVATKFQPRHAQLSDLDFCIGNEAVEKASTSFLPDSLAFSRGRAANPSYVLSNPISHGIVENWDHMERFWQQSIYQYLRVDPTDHAFILTEPPLNTPENREYTAEVMFETFNVSGLFIGMQAVLALYANFAMNSKKHQTGASLTGTVIDIGDGVTHIIPVVDNYVIGGSIKSIPIAGKEVTLFIQHMLRERGEAVPPDMSFDVSREIKETLCYTCSDAQQEHAKYQSLPGSYMKQFKGTNPKTNQEFVVNVKQERFLAPEVFFNPSMISPTFNTPLQHVVDSVIQSCPIDTRRALYGNIVLSGGSTMFKDFGVRLQRDLTLIANSRLQPGAKAIDVRVQAHSATQMYAAWLGGSVLGAAPTFPNVCHTREEYLEYGPSICRTNYVFQG